tara:strand:+ start:1738 stop:3141 length:1404 start_codon:yes stop_codon:yes gene_type:complete
MNVTPEQARMHHLGWLIYSSNGEYKPYRHIARMSKHFMEVLAGRRPKRTIIQIPPQHTKSSTVTECLSTYFLGANPGKKVGICSYNADLAEDFGYRNKMRMQQYGGEVFGVEIDRSRNSKSDWGIDGHTSGGMVSVGIGGSLTGKRLDLLIVDDAFKNYEDSMSSSQRDKVWNWLMTVAFTRLSKNAPIIIIGTRWHADDHIGRLINQSKDPAKPQFDLISFPAIAVEDEYDEEGLIWRHAGEPLCPELHPLDRLMEMKSQMSSFQWDALYQQDPSNPEGSFWSPGLFGDNEIFHEWPKTMQYFVGALDPSTGGDTKKGDYPAVSFLGTAGTGHFFTETIMKRLPPSSMCSVIADKFAEIKSSTGMYPQAFGVERQGYSQLYAHALQKTFSERGIQTPLVPVDHQSINKALRIQRLDPYITGRDIKFKSNLETSLCLQQLKDFPGGKHDDGPDSLEMAFRVLGQYAI